MDMVQKRPYETPKAEVIELSSNPVLQEASWPSSENVVPPVDDSEEGLYGD